MASEEIEKRMNEHEREIRLLRKRYSHKQVQTNLTPLQTSLIKTLAEDCRYKILGADKNCGLAIANTDPVIKQAIAEHLGDSNVYKRLTRGEAHGQLSGVGLLVESFISKWAEDLSVAECTFLRRGYKRDRHGMARFYTLIKVHKNPHTFRPIVATCGTVLLILSSWLDYKLKQLLPFVETYIKTAVI